MQPLWFLDLLMRSMFGVACCTYVTACFDQMDFARVAVHGDPLPRRGAVKKSMLWASTSVNLEDATGCGERQVRRPSE